MSCVPTCDMTEDQEVCTKLSSNVKMAGFLDKKGSMLWKRYWFVLEGKLLLFYKTQWEYINLSPCRGSVNMGLKAKDRQAQEKWLHALLDSIGKPGTNTLQLSLDNLTEERSLGTLTPRIYGGSLDAVWNIDPTIPKTKLLDKVLRYEDDPDENQNIDSNKQKSQTLDNRHIENIKMSETTFGKLRNAITGRRSSASASVKSKKPRKASRSESFLNRVFRRGSSTSATSNSLEEIGQPSSIIDEPQRTDSPVNSSEAKTPDVLVTDSDLDDPLYDKIRPTENAEEGKTIAGSKILLPAGTMAELKDRLKSKEVVKKVEDVVASPPALPPRHSGNFEITEAVVHAKQPETQNDSEDSELSGNYQVIRKPAINNVEVVSNPLLINEVELSDDSETSGHYQKILQPVQDAIHSAYQGVRSVFGSGNTEEEPESKSPIIMTSSLLWNAMEASNLPEPTPEADYQVVDLEMKKKHRLEKAAEVSSGITLPEIGIDQAIVVGLFPVLVDTPITNEKDIEMYDSLLGICSGMKRIQHDRKPAPARFREEAQKVDDFLGTDFEEQKVDDYQATDLEAEKVDDYLGTDLEAEKVDDYLGTDLEPEKVDDFLGTDFDNIVDEALDVLEIKTNEAKKQMETGMENLSALLGQLAAMNTEPLEVGPPPISPKTKMHVTTVQAEDPDYDIPRPHAPSSNNEENVEDRLPATEFFNQAENASSLEPDSLEGKKETA